ncbi:vesicle-associated membrane protein-associated protein A [Neodiprion pinetum]|uniref:Vesicle-associated membrane protein-associated protein A n=1 Tax=Neodiprion lecontei TaxID=441921 RepID=A0A6J0BI50_NEOLC|nr:vesicle-associated membrane protein-associated protein A [Neodiprion lecontei]XP_046491597.1 vesicle-associated membrane protein-associated protein A-like [Neodiprion pinetum]
MAKPEQILIIEPQGELRFRGPFTSPVTTYMKLTNPSDHKVYFKIKTTAPKKYCVRPNSGALKPKGVTQIAVCLQPFDFVPGEKNKHKFMVQTMIAPEDDDEDFVNESLWKDINPDQLMDFKLKCVFENPVSNTTAESSDAADDDKNKGIGDSVKSSPKPHGKMEEELMKAALEVKQLREEESNLRQENLQLKEELIRLRHAASGTATITSGNMAALAGLTANSGDKLNPTKIPTSVLIAIAMVVVGYLLGKLI